MKNPRTIALALGGILTMAALAGLYASGSFALATETTNNVTLTIFTHRNVSKLAQRLGVSLHFNEFVHLVQGLKIELYRVERTVAHEGTTTTVTTKITLTGSATTNEVGQATFIVPSGHYVVKLIVAGRDLTLRKHPILVFSDRSIYLPLDQLLRHRR